MSVVADFSFSQIGYTDYIIVEARRTDDDTVVAGVPQVFGTPPPANVNVIYPGLDPGIHKFYFYESVDGINKGFLISIFQVDVETNIVISERRFYTANGIGEHDPIDGDTQITDPYLDGKTISGVFKEGFRFLEPETEFTLVVGGGVELLNGQNVRSGEKIVIEIDYLVNQVVNTNSGVFDGIATIVNNTTLDATYLNKRCKCESPSSRLVIILDLLANVADGKALYFTTHKGSQLQTKFITQAGELITYQGADVTEVTLGKGEFMWLEKRGTRYEVVNNMQGVSGVGERFAAGYIGHPNCLPEDGRLLDGDDYPRLYYWIKNILPVSHYINVTEAAITGAYVHPADKKGLFVVSTTTKKFRMPNTQELSEKGLKDFDIYGTDVKRLYDYPGGVMNDSVGPHRHLLFVNKHISQGSFPAAPTSSTQTVYYWTKVSTGAEGYYLVGDGDEPSIGRSGLGDGTETNVKNIGVIYLRRC